VKPLFCLSGHLSWRPQHCFAAIAPAPAGWVQQRPEIGSSVILFNRNFHACWQAEFALRAIRCSDVAIVGDARYVHRVNCAR
jgi:hypothetical protein